MRRISSAASTTVSISPDLGAAWSSFEAIIENASLDRAEKMDLSSAVGAGWPGRCPDGN